MKRRVKLRNNGVYKVLGHMKQRQADDRVLKAIKNMDNPIDLQTLSEALNLHRDTVRKHLYRLRREGKVRITRNPKNKNFVLISYIGGGDMK